MGRHVSALLAAGGVIALFALALYAMAVGRLGIAGVTFLSASVLIYLRERFLAD
ncbi:hypothetical protein [Halarchaeum salinum]|uniref:Uncharacterized protein n=1 Tax=Halarchaeum salinum TaxID=489912 RepID=A0AAV3S8D3_9EURY